MKTRALGGAGQVRILLENLQRENTELPRADQVPRHIGETLGVVLSNNDRDVSHDEIEDLRRTWWRYAAGGVVLPPERGVIVTGGDR